MPLPKVDARKLHVVILNSFTPERVVGSDGSERVFMVLASLKEWEKMKNEALEEESEVMVKEGRGRSGL